MKITCTRCGSDNYRKNGSYQGVQRYICKTCKACFSDKIRKFTHEHRKKALDMYLNNVGIRKIARFIGACPATICNWVKQEGQKLAREVEQVGNELESGLPDIIEMDEIYTFVQKNSKEPSYGLLIAGNKARLLPMSSVREWGQP